MSLLSDPTHSGIHPDLVWCEKQAVSHAGWQAGLKHNFFRRESGVIRECYGATRSASTGDHKFEASEASAAALAMA